jgi:hypothetical protein
MQQTIDQAIQIIGENNPGDYRLDPQGHAKAYREAAPALAQLLDSTGIKSIGMHYAQYDVDAGEAQKRFKETARLANWSLLVAAVASALLPVFESYAWIIGCGAVAVVAGAAAGMFLHQLNAGQPLKVWMQRRARAESLRLHYFERVVEPREEGAGVFPLALLQLEYFRRYQLDVQCDYYRHRGRQHEAAAVRTLQLGSLAVFIGSLGTGLATALGIMNPEWASLAVIGVTGSALAAFASTRESTHQDVRNSERYERTAWTLQKLYERLDEVRSAVAAGKSDVLQAFVTAVQDQLSLEHRQWLEAMDENGGAIGKLEKRLTELHDK